MRLPGVREQTLLFEGEPLPQPSEDSSDGAGVRTLLPQQLEETQ